MKTTRVACARPPMNVTDHATVISGDTIRFAGESKFPVWPTVKMQEICINPATACARGRKMMWTRAAPRKMQVADRHRGGSGRRATASISTSAPSAKAVTPTVVRAGSWSAGK